MRRHLTCLLDQLAHGPHDMLRMAPAAVRHGASVAGAVPTAAMMGMLPPGVLEVAVSRFHARSNRHRHQRLHKRSQYPQPPSGTMQLVYTHMQAWRRLVAWGR